jgi:hypothetical protein
VDGVAFADSPTLTKLWRHGVSEGTSETSEGCSFVSEAVFAQGIASRGAPQKVVSSFAISAQGIEINTTSINKTATRLPEALWVTFSAQGHQDGRDSSWKLRYFDGSVSDISPTDVVEHGAVHLHALGTDGSLVCAAADMAGADGGPVDLEIVSLDIPVVSAGLLSPFPTALDTATRDNDTALISSWIQEAGWHFNVQNQIWNTNFVSHRFPCKIQPVSRWRVSYRETAGQPQWYPFDPADTDILARFTVFVGRARAVGGA